MSRSQAYIRLISTSRWQKLRRAKIADQPFCERCQERGRWEPATEVHHIVPCETARTEEEMERLMFDPSNLMSLCHDCHTIIHTESGSRKRKGMTGKERERQHNDALMERFLRKFGGEGEG